MNNRIFGPYLAAGASVREAFGWKRLKVRVTSMPPGLTMRYGMPLASRAYESNHTKLRCHRVS
jgi:hypothetical protein